MQNKQNNQQMQQQLELLQQQQEQQQQQIRLLQEQQQLQNLQQQHLLQQLQQQQQVDWKSTLSLNERLNNITQLSESLKSLSPTIADRKIMELAKTFDNVTLMRSFSKAEYHLAHQRKLLQIRNQISN